MLYVSIHIKFGENKMTDDYIIQLANTLANNYINGEPTKIPNMKFVHWSILLKIAIANVNKLKRQ